MNNTITNRDGQLVSCDGPVAVDAFRLRCLVSALTLEIKCPGMKAFRGGALKAAKRITGLKSNDRAKHVEAAERMLAEQVAKCTVVNQVTELREAAAEARRDYGVHSSRAEELDAEADSLAL